MIVFIFLISEMENPYGVPILHGKLANYFEKCCNFAAVMTKLSSIHPGYKAALFDLDGVICDTEPLYVVFWQGVLSRYYSETDELIRSNQGQTLVQILDKCFPGPLESEREKVVRELYAYEAQMDYPYVPGFESFLESLKADGRTVAVVTSSNHPKMENVFRAHPALRNGFDAILTSEDFTESKPSPQCYLRAAERLNLDPSECIVFEDSVHGLRSGRAAGMFTVALITTNTLDVVAPLSDLQFLDFTTILP